MVATSALRSRPDLTIRHIAVDKPDHLSLSISLYGPFAMALRRKQIMTDSKWGGRVTCTAFLSISPSPPLPPSPAITDFPSPNISESSIVHQRAPASYSVSCDEGTVIFGIGETSERQFRSKRLQAVAKGAPGGGGRGKEANGNELSFGRSDLSTMESPSCATDSEQQRRAPMRSLDDSVAPLAGRLDSEQRCYRCSLHCAASAEGIPSRRAAT